MWIAIYAYKCIHRTSHALLHFKQKYIIKFSDIIIMNFFGLYKIYSFISLRDRYFQTYPSQFIRNVIRNLVRLRLIIFIFVLIWYLHVTIVVVVVLHDTSGLVILMKNELYDNLYNIFNVLFNRVIDYFQNRPKIYYF